MTAKQHFETERLRLRGLLVSDRSFIGDLVGDETVRRYFSRQVPIAEREAYISRYFSKSAAVREMAWLVETKEGRRSLGVVLLSTHKDGEDFELSYQFQPRAWALATLRKLQGALSIML